MSDGGWAGQWSAERRENGGRRRIKACSAGVLDYIFILSGCQVKVVLFTADRMNLGTDRPRHGTR
jgi:hypothetical protein